MKNIWIQLFILGVLTMSFNAHSQSNDADPRLGETETRGCPEADDTARAGETKVIREGGEESGQNEVEDREV